MRKIFFFTAIFYSSFAFCLSDETTQNPKKVYHLQEKKSTKQSAKSPPTYQDDMQIEHSINESYYKVLIKQRAKLKPQEYHYTKVKTKKDLKKAGVVVKKNSKAKKVINFVEIKNIKGSSFSKKNESENVGVVVDKKAKTPKEILNIVNIKNSDLDSKSMNIGVRVKKNRFQGKITNDVKVKNSNIGEE